MLARRRFAAERITTENQALNPSELISYALVVTGKIIPDQYAVDDEFVNQTKGNLLFRVLDINPSILPMMTFASA